MVERSHSIMRTFNQFLLLLELFQFISAAKISLDFRQTIKLKNVTDSEKAFQLAKPCDTSKCFLPNCHCADVSLDGTIQIENIPQFVTVTFDDAVTAINYEYIDNIFGNIRNPDKCSPSATFYVSHEYTDYTKLHDLWKKGHEIALHSISHGTGTTYWKEATVDLYLKEFGQQLEMIEQFAKIDKSYIKGIRIPHLQMSGNNSFIAAKQLGLLYDSSWPTSRYTSPPLWPYTLDYKSIQDCPIGECPEVSIVGFWENPLVNWEDSKGYKCAMLDSCIHMPEDNLKDILDWMTNNFNRHYLSNRAPFGVYLHSAWFLKGKHYLAAFKEFIRYLSEKPDVYLVSVSKVIEYMQNPVEGKPFKDCAKVHESTCITKKCQLRKIDSNDIRYMNVCDSCPVVYPWLDNPLGKKLKVM